MNNIKEIKTLMKYPFSQKKNPVCVSISKELKNMLIKYFVRRIALCASSIVTPIYIGRRTLHVFEIYMWTIIQEIIWLQKILSSDI